MLAVVSPAKSLDYETPLDATHQALDTTQPRLLEQSGELAEIMKQKSYLDLMEMMGISEKLAHLNVERFQQFQVPMPANLSKPAVLAFTGDVYQGLDAKSMSASQLQQAQQQLRILSGFYGVLRPLDQMMAYRLEMGKKVSTQAGDTLYDFWRTQVTELLNQDIDASGAKALVNLASNEYSKVIDKRKLNAPIIEPVFQDEKNGKMKIISFYAKKARGLMARYIIEQGVDSIVKLQEFNWQGYEYNANESSDTKLVFQRRESARP